MRKLIYVAIVVVIALATVGVLLLLQNIFARQREAEQVVFRLVELDENTIDPAHVPRQYDGYIRMGFHSDHETARTLAEAIDFARQGQLAARKAQAR
ncbi:MAG: hypothetical protein L0Y44_07030 [Phycisphaerales bacterium]|nr:hypothetical protein [Phycisphaerales bacterium]MCI0630394.1 hypothetical protein [Phycisphaerales bacterium]MCI0675828.1 hypothetical protein [Phycisphaerales bacterium]